MASLTNRVVCVIGLMEEIDDKSVVQISGCIVGAVGDAGLVLLIAKKGF